MDEMGIQRKSKRSLLNLIESQPGNDAPGKSTQPQLPPPPLPKLPLPPPQPSLPPRAEPVDPKRKREQKGKEVLEAGRPRPTLEEETQRATKQQKTRQARQKGSKRRENQTSEPQAWLLAPMLNGEPLRDNASIRNFHGGDGCHVASALEEALILPNDMAELQSIRRHEVFLHIKRYLGMVCTRPPFLFFFVFTSLWLFVRLPTLFFQAVQAAFRVEEITNSGYY